MYPTIEDIRKLQQKDSTKEFRSAARYMQTDTLR